MATGHKGRRLRARRSRRDRRLSDAHAPLEGLRRLTDRIELIEDSSAALSADLQDLLDHVADLTIAKTRYVAVLSVNDPSRLEMSLQAIPESGPSLRREVLNRRLEHLDACTDRIDALDEEIATVTELVELVVQRALLRACVCLTRAPWPRTWRSRFFT